MKILAVILTFSACVPSLAFADGNRVSTGALRQLGLGEMAAMTDAEGDQVRGSAGIAMGTSVLSGFLFDPNTKSFIIGAEADSAMSVGPFATTIQSSSLALNLNIALNGTPVFSGLLFGGAGGFARISP